MSCYRTDSFDALPDTIIVEMEDDKVLKDITTYIEDTLTVAPDLMWP